MFSLELFYDLVIILQSYYILSNTNKFGQTNVLILK